jgi:membrane-bound lytic murein transglycosylase D
MPIRTRFYVAAAVFLTLFASGRAMPSAVASPWPEGGLVGAAVEHAALPPADDLQRPELVEEWLDAIGAVAEQEAASETEPAGVDPWAEAFAESSRAWIVTRQPPDYPLTLNPQIEHFLDRFTGARRDVVELWVGRSGRYLGMIREVLRSHGMPEELAYTAMIESGFNPLAVSRMGAKGLWQFMAATARRYGLRVDQWIDERLDPEKSTVAAAAYLRDLYAMFGSWTLAQAAYNAGEMKVTRAIRATGSSDFWALAKTNHLKPETRNFVPAIQAATHIAKDPERYGFQFTEAEPPTLETVAVPPATDLRRLSSKAGIELETLKRLNPVLVRGVTPPGAPWELRVPAGTRGNVITALAPPPRPTRPAASVARTNVRRVSGDTSHVHVVRPRDTVSSIAKQYGVSVKDVLRWNRLEHHARIRPGDRLRVADLRPAVERDGQGGFR